MSGQRGPERLVRVTDTVLQSSLARLKAASEARREIETRIAALDADRRRMAQDVELPSTRAGADLLWHRWAEARRAELNIALARAIAAQQRAHQATVKAFGRDQALRKVLSRHAGRE